MLQALKLENAPSQVKARSGTGSDPSDSAFAGLMAQATFAAMTPVASNPESTREDRSSGAVQRMESPDIQSSSKPKERPSNEKPPVEAPNDSGNTAKAAGTVVREDESKATGTLPADASKKVTDPAATQVTPKAEAEVTKEPIQPQAPAAPSSQIPQGIPGSQLSQPGAQIAIAGALAPEALPAMPEVQAVKPEAQTVIPKAQGVKPEALVVIPETLAVQPEVQAVKPETLAVIPEAQGVKPEALVVIPEALSVKPEVQAVIPEALVVIPETLAVKPEAQAVIPEAQAVTPEAKAVIPGAQAVTPEVQAGIPEAQAVIPTVQAVKPEVQAPAPIVRASGSLKGILQEIQPSEKVSTIPVKPTLTELFSLPKEDIPISKQNPGSAKTLQTDAPTLAITGQTETTSDSKSGTKHPGMDADSEKPTGKPSVPELIRSETPTQPLQNQKHSVSTATVPMAEGSKASQAASHAEPVRLSPVFTQVEGSIRWILQNKTQGAELQLHPESLGRMVIQLRVEGQEVHARLWASEPASLAILQDHKAFLESSLREQGLHLGSFDMHSGARGDGAQTAPQERAVGGASIPLPHPEVKQELPIETNPDSAEGYRFEVFA